MEKRGWEKGRKEERGEGECEFKALHHSFGRLVPPNPYTT